MLISHNIALPCKIHSVLFSLTGYWYIEYQKSHYYFLVLITVIMDNESKSGFVTVIYFSFKICMRLIYFRDLFYYLKSCSFHLHRYLDN